MRLIQKYRPKLALAVLTFFLVGIFQNPILEGLHFLSHLDDFANGNCQYHSFNSHNSEHEHLVIDIIKGDSELPLNEDLPINQNTSPDSKKLTQFVYENSGNLSEISLLKSKPIGAKMSIRLFHLEVPCPPPKG